MKIGIFDSGVGGLTVLNTAMKIIPDAEYIYYADLDNVPYGTREKDEVRNLTYEAVEFLRGKGAEAVVIACNTATSTSVEKLRKSFDMPIIGMEPAIKPAIENSEEKFQNLVSRLNGDNIIEALPMPELVEKAENFDFNHENIESLFKRKLENYDLDEFSAIVLGCTHFIYFKNVLEKIVNEGISVIDGNIGTVNHLLRTIKEHDIYEKTCGSVEYYISGRKAEDRNFVKYLNHLNKNNI